MIICANDKSSAYLLEIYEGSIIDQCENTMFRHVYYCTLHKYVCLFDIVITQKPRERECISNQHSCAQSAQDLQSSSVS